MVQEYKAKFYKNSKTLKEPVKDYLEGISKKDRVKINKYIQFLIDNNGYLDEPYSKHIRGKIRELRVDFASNRHRIFYFAFIEKTIILLHAFIKRTDKTPDKEILKAENNYIDTINNPNIYE